MQTITELLIAILLGGIGGCLAMDIWQRIVYAATGNPPSNWAMVGRWFYYTATEFRLFQRDIEDKPAISYELKLGWVAHYLVGGAYALVYLVISMNGWLDYTITDGLIFGGLSVVVPWFFFLPAMGKGIMARNTPAPFKICLLALLTHFVFGVGVSAGLAVA